MAIELISNITPKNNGKFPLVDAKDVQVDNEGTRLDAALAMAQAILDNLTPITMTESEYAAAVEAGTIDENKTYFVVGDADE